MYYNNNKNRPNKIEFIEEDGALLAFGIGDYVFKSKPITKFTIHDGYAQLNRNYEAKAYMSIVNNLEDQYPNYKIYGTTSKIFFKDNKTLDDQVINTLKTINAAVVVISINHEKKYITVRYNWLDDAK